MKEDMKEKMIGWTETDMMERLAHGQTNREPGIMKATGVEVPSVAEG